MLEIHNSILKKLLVIQVGIMIVFSICFSSIAKATTTLVFTPGEELVVFDQNGVKLTLTGEVVDDGMMFLQINAVAENTTSQNIKIHYSGVVNGWTVNDSVLGGSNSGVNANAKAKTYLWLLYDDLDIKRFNDIETAWFQFITVDSATDETLFTTDTVEFAFGEMMREIVYFDECPILPKPISYVDVYESGSNTSSINGKVSSITYRFAQMNNADQTLREVYDQYIAALKNEGYTVTVSQNQATILSGSTKLAVVSINGSNIEFSITPGNEKLTAKPSGASSNSSSNVSASGDLKVSLGEKLTLKNCTLTLDRATVEKAIYSYGSKKTDGRYYYLEPENKNSSFVSLYGTFTNTGSTPVDIRYIYAILTIDGQYTYEAKATGILDGGSDFYNKVSPMETVGICVYAEVPTNLANTSRATVRLGFTEGFTPRVLRNGLPDFDKCYQTYDVSLTKDTTASSSSNNTVVGRESFVGTWYCYKWLDGSTTYYIKDFNQSGMVTVLCNDGRCFHALGGWGDKPLVWTEINGVALLPVLYEPDDQIKHTAHLEGEDLVVEDQWGGLWYYTKNPDQATMDNSSFSLTAALEIIGELP